MQIPPNLLAAIAAQSGQITIVIGAGCSIEHPTNLRTAREYALRAHDALRASNILAADADDPADLSSVADAVVKSTGSQRVLVDQFPIEEFRGALPNEGYLIAAAMMREGVVSSIVTLNFDLAMSRALADLGASEVTVLKTPQEHNRLGTLNLVYLHRNVEANPDDWILTSEALEAGWKDNWEKVMVNRALSSPVVVFAGLGTAAAVLVKSVEKIRESLPQDQVNLYHVDVAKFKNSDFAGALDIAEDQYVQMPWVEFMRRSSERLIAKYVGELKTACGEVMESLDLADVSEDSFSRICDNIGTLGLVRIGKLRAHCLLHQKGYCIGSDERTAWIADMVLALAVLQEHLAAKAYVSANGLVTLIRDGEQVTSLFIAHGRDLFGWIKLEHQLSLRLEEMRAQPLLPRFALVSGVYGNKPEQIAPPKHIALKLSEESIIDALGPFDIVTVFELREDQSIIDRIVG